MRFAMHRLAKIYGIPNVDTNANNLNAERELNWTEKHPTLFSHGYTLPISLSLVLYSARFVRTCGNSLWALSFQWISHGTRYTVQLERAHFHLQADEAGGAVGDSQLQHAGTSPTHTHTHTLARSVCICICIRICFSCCLAWINYPGTLLCMRVRISILPVWA